jgi:hypothetical protein
MKIKYIKPEVFSAINHFIHASALSTAASEMAHQMVSGLAQSNAAAAAAMGAAAAGVGSLLTSISKKGSKNSDLSSLPSLSPVLTD